MKNITLYNFNDVRHFRGADAARFKIEYDDDYELLWMSICDIKKNIKLFPQFEEELKKGLAAYGVKS